MFYVNFISTHDFLYYFHFICFWFNSWLYLLYIFLYHNSPHLLLYCFLFCFVFFIAYFRVNPCNPRFCRIKEIDALCCDFDLLDCLATYTVDAGNNAGLSLLWCGCIVLEVMLYCRYFIFYGEPFVFFSLVLFTLNFTSTLSFCSVRWFLLKAFTRLLLFLTSAFAVHDFYACF